MLAYNLGMQPELRPFLVDPLTDPGDSLLTSTVPMLSTLPRWQSLYDRLKRQLICRS